MAPHPDSIFILMVRLTLSLLTLALLALFYKVNYIFTYPLMISITVLTRPYI